MQVITLKSIINSDFIRGNNVEIKLVKQELGLPMNPAPIPEADKKTLDIAGVIISEKFAEVLNDWIRDYGLHAIDSAHEYRNEILVHNYQYHEERRRMLKLCDFLVNGKFNETSVRKMEIMLSHLMGQGVTNKIKLSIAERAPIDTQSVRNIAIYLLVRNNVFEIVDPTSEFGLNHLLPAASQLVHDCKDNKTYWTYLQNTYPVGSSVYVSRRKEELLKCVVTRQEEMSIILSPDTGAVITTVSEDIDDVDSPAEEETDLGGYFTLTYGEVIDREVFFFPVEMFENADKELPVFPESEIRKRKATRVDKSYSLLRHDTGENSSDIDFIEKFRELYYNDLRQRGFEPPEEVDLIRIMRGEDSPYAGLKFTKTGEVDVRRP